MQAESSVTLGLFILIVFSMFIVGLPINFTIASGDGRSRNYTYSGSQSNYFQNI